MKKFEQLDEQVKLLLWHHPWNEAERNQKKLLHPETGPYFYFRRSKSPIHEYLTLLIDHRKIPNVFIHGSPHIDNYAKTLAGAGMVDFDRAYIGPYAWDIVCLLLAISLRNPEHHQQGISSSIADTLLESYIQSFLNPDEGYQRFQPLENITPKNWELNIHHYLKSEKKWARCLALDTLDLNDPLATALLKDFIHHSADKDRYTNYHPAQIAHGDGSFGRKRYIYLLEKAEHQHPILLDIKQTKDYLNSQWSYVRWYRNPFFSDGQRLYEAAKLYAPSFATGESYATVNGVDYWGRLIPTLNRKPEKIFDEHQQLLFATSGGSQLGRGHRLSLHEISAETFLKDFKQRYPELIQASNTIKQNLMIVWQAYCQEFTKGKL